MRRIVALSVVALVALFLPGAAAGQPSGAEAKVTDHTYVRHDGGTDDSIDSCGSDATTPEPGGDDGGNAQQNEPSVAIDPSDPDVIVAGANDYCTVSTFGDVWMGFYVSDDGGQTWVNGLNPGYPTDTSAEGRDSPIFGVNTAAGDPIMDWDHQGRLYYGGIAFNRTVSTDPVGTVQPTNGNVIVSTWARDPSAPLGLDYLRTVVVGEGTPSAFFFGRFNDKPSLRVDDWEGSPHQGNVYVAWTLFPGAGQDQILFSRSTDHGVTFSRPIKISRRVASAQGSDIAVAPDGTVYVVWREFAQLAAGVDDSIVFVRSTDGGRTFSDPREIAPIVPFDRSDVRASSGDPARDCGDGPFLCVSEFVFHRVATLPQAVADAQGAVHVAWEEVIPSPDDADTYRPDGQAQVAVTTSLDGGATWTTPELLDPQDTGHQWWPNLEYDRATETLVAVYFDSRTDPGYSVNRPTGNTAQATSSGDEEVLNTFVATSSDGASWSSTRVSGVGHQPNYEMFGNRDVPFHGDYLWVDANGGKLFGVWVDNRDVVPGEDPREAMQDGFDVVQCRELQEDGTFGPDHCPNAGGLNQNIYGYGGELPP